jgi:DedD protein
MPVNPATVDPADLVRSSEGLPGLQAPPSVSAAQEGIRYYNGETQESLAERTTRNNQTQLTITVSPPAGSTASAARAAPAKAAPTRAAPAASSTAARTAAPAATGSRSSGGSAAPARTAAPAASTVAAPAQVYDAFWVQTGSFSTRVRADGAKGTLAEKGITSIIENRDVEGKTYYRVRVGPYTSQNEADYWLSLVKTINGFEESQVWKSQARR